MYIYASPRPRHSKVRGKGQTRSSVYRTLSDHREMWTGRLPSATTWRSSSYPQCFPYLPAQEMSSSSLGKSTTGSFTAGARPHIRRTAHQNPRPERESHKTKDHPLLQGPVEQSYRRRSHMGIRIVSNLQISWLSRKRTKVPSSSPSFHTKRLALESRGQIPLRGEGCKTPGVNK